MINTNLIGDEDRIDSPFNYIHNHTNQIYTNICNTCFNRRARILCAGCKCVYYCTKNCQTIDWNIHKIVCKPLQSSIQERETISSSLHLSLKSELLSSKQSVTDRLLLDAMHNEYENNNLMIYLLTIRNIKAMSTEVILPRNSDNALEATKQSTHQLLTLLYNIPASCHSPSYVEILPDLLLRLNLDQFAYDMIYWNTTRMKDRDHIESRSCIPPLHECYQDRSVDILLINIKDKGRVVFSHIVILTLIKIRLYLNFNNLDAFYTFLNIPNHCTGYKYLSKLIDQLKLLRLIRAFVIDTKQNVPFTKFAIRDKSKLLEQIEQLLAIIESIHPNFLNQLFDSKLKIRRPEIVSCSGYSYVERIGHHKLMRSCLAYDNNLQIFLRKYLYWVFAC